MGYQPEPMTNPKPAGSQEEQLIRLHWPESTDLAQIMADEAVVQVVSDRVYLTIGQVQMHPTFALTGVKSLEVEPVARLVYTIPAFHKLVSTLTSVADQMKAQQTT